MVLHPLIMLEDLGPSSSAGAQEGSLMCPNQSCVDLQSTWEARSPSKSGVTLENACVLPFALM